MLEKSCLRMFSVFTEFSRYSIFKIKIVCKCSEHIFFYVENMLLCVWFGGIFVNNSQNLISQIDVNSIHHNIYKGTYFFLTINNRFNLLGI